MEFLTFLVIGMGIILWIMAGFIYTLTGAISRHREPTTAIGMFLKRALLGPFSLLCRLLK